MKRERAIEILEALLDGANPLTGEVLPRDHVCQEADVMRALHAAVLALQDADASGSGAWALEEEQRISEYYDVLGLERG